MKRWSKRSLPHRYLYFNIFAFFFVYINDNIIFILSFIYPFKLAYSDPLYYRYFNNIIVKNVSIRDRFRNMTETFDRWFNFNKFLCSIKRLITKRSIITILYYCIYTLIFTSLYIIFYFRYNFVIMIQILIYYSTKFVNYYFYKFPFFYFSSSSIWFLSEIYTIFYSSKFSISIISQLNNNIRNIKYLHICIYIYIYIIWTVRK